MKKYIILVLFFLGFNCLWSNTWKETYQQASKYIESGEYYAALKSARQSVEFANKEFGKESEYHSQTYNIIGEIFFKLNDYDESIEYFKKAIELKRITLGSNHPSYAISLHNLANVYQTLGRYSQAEPLLVEAIKIKEANGSDIASLAKSYQNLAQIFQQDSRYYEAEFYYKKALEMKKKSLNADDQIGRASCRERV